jgi:porin
MKPEGRFAALTILLAAFVLASAGQSTSTSPPQNVPSEQPGANQDEEFHSPFPVRVAKNPDEFNDKYLLGDWMGVRSKLTDQGVSISVLLITDPFGNLTGGQRRGASDYSLVAFGVVLRTDQILGWQGGQFHVGFADNFGTSLSRDYVGNSFPVQLADVADAHPRLTYLSYTQSLFKDTLSIRLGRLTINSVADEEFLSSQYFKAFTSVGLDLVPLGLFLNAPGAFGYPGTTWGARIKFAPVKEFYTMIGAYDGDPRLKQGTRHGVDFSMRGPIFLIGEFGFRRNHEESSASLSSNLKFGGYYNGGAADAFALSTPSRPSETLRDRYGMYVVGDQVLLRFGDSNQDHHLGAFGAFIVAPDHRVNQVPYFFDTGLVMYGPSRRRPKDFAGLAVVYGDYSDDLRHLEEIQPTSMGVQHFEMTLELNYGWTVRPGLLLQPDVQYVIHPNGNKTLPNALVMGINIVVNL